MYETFWLELTDRERRWLRRYAEGPCSARDGDEYHSARVVVEPGPITLTERDENGRRYHESPSPRAPEFCHDRRWLEIAHCECGYTFTNVDAFQVLTRAIYRRFDTGEEITLKDAPVGAMWDAWWMGDSWRGEDGLCVVCVLPGGHQWTIDGRASNCTRPGEPHHCWVRHGTPPHERVNVDKNGNTCAAGGGSIWVHKPVEWHGFLRDGRLVEVGET